MLCRKLFRSSQAATQAHGDRSKWDQQQAALERVREQGRYLCTAEITNSIFVHRLPQVCDRSHSESNAPRQHATDGRRTFAGDRIFERVRMQRPAGE